MSTGLERQVELMRQQAQACRALGSPLYATLLDALSGNVSDGGVGARVLAGHEADPGPSAVALRLMAAVHRIVLTGRAPALAAHYPSTGGDGDAAAAWPAFHAVLEEHLQEIRGGLASPPQTNEVGRAAALFGGLLQVVATAERPELPVRLVEIGSSAGLNLLADQFTYRTADGRTWHPDDIGPELRTEAGPDVDGDVAAEASQMPTVTLDPAWETWPPGIPPAVRVVERLGCDLSPVDPRSDDGALALQSCVWPDQTHRMDRLRGALSLAQTTQFTVRRQGAGDFLDALDLAEGQHTVVWHSVMWQYVPEPEQRRMVSRLEVLGAAATADSTLTHLAFEPRRLRADAPHRFVVAATTWPDGAEHLLGEAPPHGVPVRWGDPRSAAARSGGREPV